MSDLEDPKKQLPDTVSPASFPIGSPESRAAARAKVEARPKPPTLEPTFRSGHATEDGWVDDDPESLPPTCPAHDRRDGGAGATKIRHTGIIARCTIEGRIEAFQNRAGEDENTFLTRLRERFPDAKFSTLSWPARENCPYTGPAAQVKETAARFGLSE
jgi:hypothetical protein